jgi:hypothetical protein
MKPLGLTRPLLAYGVPAAAGLAIGGALAGQGEDPGTAVLGGIAGALGARGGLGAARLAGKYAPAMAEPMASKVLEGMEATIGRKGFSPRGAKVANAIMGPAADVISTVTNPKVAGYSAAAAAVPLAGGLAGLGGVAAGAIPGALGVPGFQQDVAVDPESYGSSNSPGARYKAPTMQYM